MRVILVICFALLVFRCTQRIEKLPNDNVNPFVSDIHSYTYDDKGRLYKETSTSYIDLGSKIDSFITVKSYYYNSNNKNTLIKSIDDLGDVIETRVLSYDKRDSLISDYTIANTGDTIRLAENTLDINGNQILINFRDLFSVERFKSNHRASTIKYDTLISITENIYDGGRIRKSLHKDGNNNLTEEVEYIYKDKQLELIRVYEFPESKKQLAAIVYYFPQLKDFRYKEVTVNLLGDTTAFTLLEKNKNGRLIKTIDYSKNNYILVSNFSEKGQIITQVEIISALDIKTKRTYTYNSEGKKIKVVNMNELLNEEDKKML